MSSNFLDVDDSIITRNLLIAGGGLGFDKGGLDGGGDGFGPSLQNKPLFTPSDRREQAQCKFIIPTAGLCVKTFDQPTGKKVFINICKSADVPEPDFDYPDDQFATILSDGTDEEASNLRMPMSIGEVHEEKDNKGQPCIAVDIIVNKKLFEEKILVSEVYRGFLIVLAMEAIDEKHKLTVEKSNYTILSNKKSVGKLNPQFVRAKPTIQELKTPTPTSSAPVLSPNGSKKLVEEVATKESQLECKITQLASDLAKAEVKIPNLRNPKKLKVTLGADRIVVDSPVGGLDVFVPVDIHQEECKAEFDVDTETLNLHLPLVLKP